MTTAGLYCRISRDPGDRQEGVDRQLEDCKLIAEERGWNWSDDFIYIDNDTSAYAFDKPRPEFSRLMQDFQSGRIHAVVVYDVDRMYRRVREAQLLLNQVEDFGLEEFVVASDTGDYNLAKPDEADEFRDNVKSAEKYSRQISRKVARKNLSRAQKGQPRKGRHRPFGYDWVKAEDGWKLEVRPEEAALLREAAERLLQGDSLAGICKDWNSRTPPVLTSEGNRWLPRSLKLVVTAPRVAGFVQYYPKEEKERHWREAKRNNERVLVGMRELVLRDRKGQPVRGEWEPVLDEATWERLVSKLEDPSRRKVFNQGERLYLLTGGTAICGVCGGKLTAHKSAGQRAYRCANQPNSVKKKGGCRVVQVVEPLESFVRDSVIEALTGGALDKLMSQVTQNDSHEKKLLEKLRKLEQEKERLIDLLTEGVLQPQEYRPRRAQKDDEIEQLHKQLRGNGKTRLLAEIPRSKKALRKTWDDRGVNWQRSVVDVVVEHVIVHPKRKNEEAFDPKRIKFKWKV